ncbi:MAG: PAS domain S-box protein [Salinibacter sp.]
MQFLLSVLSLLRPNGGELSSEAERDVQIHRLLALISAILVFAVGSLYDATTPAAIASTWTRLGVAGLFAGLLGLSYVVEDVRRHIVVWLRGLLYLLMGWFATIAALNGFSGDYDMGLLLVYALLPIVVAIGTSRMRPVFRFLGTGFLFGAAGAVLGSASLPKSVSVLSSLASVAIVEGIAIQAHLRTQAQLREREERLEGLANSLPGVVFQGYARPDDTYGTYFVGDQAESLLGVPADSETFYSRFLDRIPDAHRETFVESIETAVETGEPWRQEVPFDTPSGERLWLLCASTPQRQEDELIFNGVFLDITDRKTAEQAVREERDRFETLFESLPTPVVRCTVEEEGTLIADANSAFEEVFGVEAESVEGVNANELLLSSDDPRLEDPDTAAEIDRRLLEGQSLEIEVRRAAAEGPRDFHLQAASRTPSDGPPELYAIYTDITEKKQYERELEKLTTRLQLALEATDTGFWEWDLDTETVFWDEACEQLFGYEPGTFPGTHEAFRKRVHPEDVDAIERETQRAIDTGDRYQVDFRIQRPEGTRRWVQSRGIVEYGEEGTPERMIGIQTDITDRKEREQELRRKERRYQAIFEDPNILVGRLTPAGTLLEANQTALEYVDASLSEVTGRPFWETPWWEEEMQPSIRRNIERAASGEYVNYEADLTTPEGNPYSIAGVIRPVTNRSGEVVSLVVSARDITQRKRRARELLAAKEEAETANRMKSAFLANMSHEIRTPLTSIIGFAEAIGDEVDADADEPIPKFASLIEDSGRHLLDTLNAVLTLSKLEAGEMELTTETVDLAAQAEEIAEQLRPQAAEAGIELNAHTPSAPAQADEAGLQVALRNLLSNAIQYTGEDGRIWVRTRQADGASVVEIDDTGIGMTPEQVPLLFEPFSQASEGMSREYEGIGLGLAVTKRMIRQMDGEIEVDTEEGAGTRFTVRLPRAK